MLIVVLLFLLLFSPQPVTADAGRFTIEPTQTEAQSGMPGIELKVKVTLSSSDSTPSVGEKIGVSVRSGGGICAVDTPDQLTDSNGYITAHCGRDSAGTISIFAFSIDSSEESSDTTLTFTAVPTPTFAPTETPAPTNTPASSSNSSSTPTPSTTNLNTTSLNKKNPVANSQGGGFGGDGLVEDQGDGGGTGLGSGQTLGAATQDIDSSGDKDLLGTLIFLTGTVVLIVWTIYAVLVQKGVISGGKKKEHTGGITPRPLE